MVEAAERLRVGHPSDGTERHHADDRQDGCRPTTFAISPPTCKEFADDARSKTGIDPVRSAGALLRAASNKRRTSARRHAAAPARRIGAADGGEPRRRRIRQAAAEQGRSPPLVPGSMKTARSRSRMSAGDSGTRNTIVGRGCLDGGGGHAGRGGGHPDRAHAWQDGVNYTRLVPAQPTAVPPDRSRCWSSSGTPVRIATRSTRWSSRGRRPSRPTSASRGCR